VNLKPKRLLAYLIVALLAVVMSPVLVAISVVYLAAITIGWALDEVLG
jgi:uncharacterized Tic20 family protein